MGRVFLPVPAIRVFGSRVVAWSVGRRGVLPRFAFPAWAFAAAPRRRGLASRLSCIVAYCVLAYRIVLYCIVLYCAYALSKCLCKVFAVVCSGRKADEAAICRGSTGVRQILK